MSMSFVSAPWKKPSASLAKLRSVGVETFFNLIGKAEHPLMRQFYAQKELQKFLPETFSSFCLYRDPKTGTALAVASDDEEAVYFIYYGGEFCYGMNGPKPDAPPVKYFNAKRQYGTPPLKSHDLEIVEQIFA